MELMAGDIVICASDGLQFLTNAQIEKVLAKYRKNRSTEIAERLLEELDKLADPDQDNISFCIIKLNDASVREKGLRIPRASLAVQRPRRLTAVAHEPMLVQHQPAEVVEDDSEPNDSIHAFQPEAVDPEPVDLSEVRMRPRRVIVVK